MEGRGIGTYQNWVDGFTNKERRMSKPLGVNLENLKTAVDWSIRQLAAPRSNRVKAVKQYVGKHYAEGGSDKVVPTNFLELAVTIYTRQLAARAPRVMVTTGSRALRPMAKSTEIALNQLPGEIGLDKTLQRAVMEGLFSMGVVKVGLNSSGVDVMGLEYGEPYVDIVSIDDYFMDMSAKSREGIQFEGNDYWLPLETAKKLYDKKDLKADDHTITGSQGETRADGVTTDEGADVYKDKVWLRDVWIHSSNQLVTYGVKSGEQLALVDWDGPDHGPYHVLGFSDVPGNILPLPPVALWRDLHELGNSLFRKLGKQAESKKTVVAFAGGDDEGVKALQNASDGEGIKYTAQKPENITVGGIDPPTLAFFLQTRDLFSYYAGNLDNMGGLAPSSDTIGQDKLLSEAASARLNFMRDRTIDFAQGIFRSLAWYEWTDPVRKRTIEKPVKGTTISVKRTWSAETRDGDFLDYNFDLDVYSMQDDTPSIKLQKIGQALERYVFPGIPLLQAQGGQIDYQEVINTVSQLGNIPELKDMITFGEPNQGDEVQAGGDAQPTTMPANTTRTYERTNRPGGTRSGNDKALTSILMGGNVQESEAAPIGKPIT